MEFQSSSYWIRAGSSPGTYEVTVVNGVSILILLDTGWKLFGIDNWLNVTMFQSSSYWIRAGSSITRNAQTAWSSFNPHLTGYGLEDGVPGVLMFPRQRFQSSSYWIRAGSFGARLRWCRYRQVFNPHLTGYGLEVLWLGVVQAAIHEFQSSSYWIRAGSFLRFHTACTYDVSILILLDTGWKPAC